MTLVRAREIELPRAGLGGRFVGGRWLERAEADTMAIENPCTRCTIARVTMAGPEDVDAAVESARAAFGAWRATPARRRGDALVDFANVLAAHKESVARLLAAETGNALRTQSRPEVAGAIEVLRYFGGVAAEQKGETAPLGGGLLSFTKREPLGVVGAIIPWNSPVVLAAVKIGMALCTGNTLVLKPAEDAPLAVLRIIELGAGRLPPGVLNVVAGTGEACGAHLARHPGVAKVSFTGSHEVGRSVMHAVADRIAHVTVELGGKSPCIVYPDSATVGTARGVIAAMRFARQGQSCTAGSRLYVHEDVWDPFLELLVEQLEGLRVGDALDEGTDVGALISQERYAAVRGYLEEAIGAGAELLTGSVPAHPSDVEGFFAQPTVLTNVDPAWRVMREEVFGPVLVATPWRSEREVLRLANDTHYGLAAYVFTRDVTTALRAADALDAGWIQVNHAGGQIPSVPYGGRKQSGTGSEYAIEGALESYTQRKTVTIGLTLDD